MEGARYRVDLEVMPQYPITPAQADRQANRLQMILPVSARLDAARVRPEDGTAELSIDVTASTPADALVEAARALEILATEIRREHQADPLGPAPVVRRATITHAP